MAIQMQIRVRRDLSTVWSLKNPTLASGEIGYESDLYRMKVGDGVTPYQNLPYITGSGEGGGGGGSGVSNLSQLLDVLIASPSNGDVLSYNSSTGKWNNTKKENLVDGGNF